MRPILVNKVVKRSWFDKSDFVETLDLRSELTTNGPNSQPSPGELV
jgi:hypothetical protein